MDTKKQSDLAVSRCLKTRCLPEGVLEKSDSVQKISITPGQEGAACSLSRDLSLDFRLYTTSTDSPSKRLIVRVDNPLAR